MTLVLPVLRRLLTAWLTLCVVGLCLANPFHPPADDVEVRAERETACLPAVRSEDRQVVVPSGSTTSRSRSVKTVPSVAEVRTPPPSSAVSPLATLRALEVRIQV